MCIVHLTLSPGLIISRDDASYTNPDNLSGLKSTQSANERLLLSAVNLGNFIAKEIGENRFNRTRIGLVNS